MVPLRILRTRAVALKEGKLEDESKWRAKDALKRGG
jgi:hypothetical protein